MDTDDLALVLAESLAEHQSRGLVDGANGMVDVVIHGRVNLAAVAEDLRTVMAGLDAPARRSWARWFVRAAERHRKHRRQDAIRQALVARLKMLPQAPDDRSMASSATAAAHGF